MSHRHYVLYNCTIDRPKKPFVKWMMQSKLEEGDWLFSWHQSRKSTKHYDNVSICTKGHTHTHTKGMHSYSGQYTVSCKTVPISLPTAACFFHISMFFLCGLVKWSQTFLCDAEVKTRSIWPTLERGHSG